MQAATLLVLTLCGVAPVAAQAVLLRVHPRVGDTLHTRLEQQTEVSGSRHGGGSIRSVSTSVTVDSRTIVQSSLPASTVVLTIVDSAQIHTTDEHAETQVAEAERMLRGRRIVLRLSSDGTLESARDAGGAEGSRKLADAMASMPAVFPLRPVRPGEQWVREMPLPTGGPLGTRGSGHVNAVFHLDSVDRAGGVAFVTVRGAVLPDGPGGGMESSGTIIGAMQVDLQRGWMTDSRFTVTTRAVVTPPAASGFTPMRFMTRVTQRLRTMDKR